MTAIDLYHNPRCSKSRSALALLRERGVEPNVIEYVKSPPDTNALLHLVAILGISVRDLLRRNETAYREMELGDESLSDETLLQAIARAPILLQRPIAIAGDHAVIARPPERVLELL